MSQGSSRKSRDDAAPESARDLDSPVAFAAKVCGFAGFWLLIFSLLFWLAVGRSMTPWASAGIVIGLAAIGAGLGMNWQGFLDVLRSRHATHGAVVMVSAGCLLVLVVAANYVAARHPVRWDITSAGRYQLDERTRKLLASLQEPVEIFTHFYPAMARGEAPLVSKVEQRVYDLLEEFRAHQPLINVERIPVNVTADAITRLRDKLGLHEQFTNAIMIRTRGRLRKISWRKMCMLEDQINRQGEREYRIRHFTVEDAVSSAIRQLVEEQPPKIYVLTGHGEPLLDGDQEQIHFRHLADDLKGLAYDVAELQGPLDKDTPVPRDCELLIIAGAGTLAPLQPHELDAITKYVDAGGHLLVALRSRYSLVPTPKPTGLEMLLAQYGVRARTDVVTAGEGILKGSISLVPARPHLVKPLHPIIAPFAGERRPAVFPLCGTLEVIRTKQRDYALTPLLRAPGNVYGERDFKPAKENSYDKGRDVPYGPYLAVAAQRKKGRGPRIVVFASTEFLSIRALYRRGINRDVFINSVSWMLGAEENIGISPRINDDGRVSVEPREARTIGIGTIVIAPLLVIVLGLTVLFVRRR